MLKVTLHADCDQHDHHLDAKIRRKAFRKISVDICRATPEPNCGTESMQITRWTRDLHSIICIPISTTCHRIHCFVSLSTSDQPSQARSRMDICPRLFGHRVKPAAFFMRRAGCEWGFLQSVAEQFYAAPRRRAAMAQGGRMEVLGGDHTGHVRRMGCGIWDGAFWTGLAWVRLEMWVECLT
jgi:hypothetical protein